MNTTSFYVVVLRDNGGRLIGNSFDNAVAKAKSHPGSSIRKASDMDVKEYYDAVIGRCYQRDPNGSNYYSEDNGNLVFVAWHYANCEWTPMRIVDCNESIEWHQELEESDDSWRLDVATRGSLLAVLMQ